MPEPTPHLDHDAATTSNGTSADPSTPVEIEVKQSAAPRPKTLVEGRTEPPASTDDALLERTRELEAELDRVKVEYAAYRVRPPAAQYAEATKRLLDVSFDRFFSRGARGTLPTMSIVTPVFNAAPYIRDTLESVLSQEYPTLEYIVVDGGSTDGTREIIEEYRPRLTDFISEPDEGMYDALRKGFDLATGDVLGYLNGDDLLEPGGLLRVGGFFRDQPRAHVAYREDTISAYGWRFPNLGQPRVDMYHLLRGHILFQDGVYFSRRAYRAIGGVDPTLRMAGDYDLWLRLSRHFTFHRAPGHVSSFRIRPGQLSADMDDYGREQELSRRNFRERMRFIGYARRIPRHLLNKGLNALDRLVRRRKFFYPMNFVGPLPPGESPPTAESTPLRCPITGQPPDRLLFSTKDTRFGHPLINYIYYCDGSDVALTWPPLSRDQLNELYETYYSTANAPIIQTPPGITSPFRGYRGGGLIGRVVRRLRLPWNVSRALTIGERGHWGEICCRELLTSVRGVFAPSDKSVRLLDLGCFEGHLLDTVKRRTTWQTCGLESNPVAAGVARDKGHEVWTCFAEDAVTTIPRDRQFDIIYLGQTIEHFDDPLLVLQRLTLLLAPGGMIVMSTPNLNSKQVELFGPTWAHWHAPYHRVLFSAKSLSALAAQCGLRRHRLNTYSNSNWTAYSIKLNQLGVGGAVPHTWGPPPPMRRHSRSLAAWSALLWNWRGRGDYVVASYQMR